MKKLFFALALTGIVGAASVNTVSAITHSKVFVNGGGDDKKKKKCTKDKACCKSKAGATADAKEGEKKCCKSSVATKTCSGKTAVTSTETKTEVKKVEEQK